MNHRAAHRAKHHLHRARHRTAARYLRRRRYFDHAVDEPSIAELEEYQRDLEERVADVADLIIEINARRGAGAPDGDPDPAEAESVDAVTGSADGPAGADESGSS